MPSTGSRSTKRTEPAPNRAARPDAPAWWAGCGRGVRAAGQWLLAARCADLLTDLFLPARPVLLVLMLALFLGLYAALWPVHTPRGPAGFVLLADPPCPNLNITS